MHSAHNQIILVNPQDQTTGLMDKMAGHQQGLAHRALSVCLYKISSNNGIELLLQKRHPRKYHSGGLWTNSCCSHPLHLESPLQAAHRRLAEELNIHHVPLQPLGKITYHVRMHDLSENEIDHIFIGQLAQQISNILPNPEEVEALKWMPLQQLQQALEETPEQYTSWLPHMMPLLLANQNVFYQTSQQAATNHA